MPTLTPPLNLPMKIRVGNNEVELISLQDLYEKCVDDRGLILLLVEGVAAAKADPYNPEKRVQARKDIANVLLSRGWVLPDKCLESLVNKLMDAPIVEQLTRWIGRPLRWEEMKKAPDERPSPGAECHWPDCPDSTT